jgi:hypothetical protein
VGELASSQLAKMLQSSLASQWARGEQVMEMDGMTEGGRRNAGKRKEGAKSKSASGRWDQKPPHEIGYFKVRNYATGRR